MPLLLRNIRKAKWYKNEGVPWLNPGELQADALADLTTKDNMLSVWQVNDDLSNLEQIIVALAAGRDVVSNLDYALLNRDEFASIAIKHTKGDTADEQVNSWHRDLIELSMPSLVAIAQSIQAKAEIKRISEKLMLDLIAKAVASGSLDQTKVRLKPDQMRRVDSVITSKGYGKGPTAS